MIWHLTINIFVFVVNYLQPQDSIIEVDFRQLVVIGLLLKLNAHVKANDCKKVMAEKPISHFI